MPTENEQLQAMAQHILNGTIQKDGKLYEMAHAALKGNNEGEKNKVKCPKQEVIDALYHACSELMEGLDDPNLIGLTKDAMDKEEDIFFEPVHFENIDSWEEVK